MAAGDQLGEGELGLLAAREGARVLEGLVAAQAEHAHEGPELLVAEPGLVAHVVEQAAAGADALVLLGVVAGRHVQAELHLAEVGLELVRPAP